MTHFPSGSVRHAENRFREHAREIMNRRAVDYSHCTFIAIRNELAQFKGVKDIDVFETMGAFVVKIKWRWWTYLTFGWYQERTSLMATGKVIAFHTAAGIKCLGAW